MTDPSGAGLTANQLAVLQSVSTEVAAALDPVRLAQLVVDELQVRFGYELPSVYFLQPDGKLHLAAQLGYAEPIEELDPSTGVSGRVARTLQPALIHDAAADADFLAATHGLVGEVCVPILGAGRLLGIINVETRRHGVLGEGDVTLLGLLAQMMAVSLGNAELYAAARRRADEFATLQVVAAQVASLQEPEHLAETVVRELCQRFGYELVALYFRSNDADRLAAAAGYPEQVLEAFDPTTGVVGRVLQTGRAALVSEPGTDPDFVPSVPGVSGQVCVPICSGPRALHLRQCHRPAPDGLPSRRADRTPLPGVGPP
jgi:GAF domain-containing protein